MESITTNSGTRKIPQDHLEILQTLQTVLDNDFYVTGSLSLYLYGVIDRPIKDLDIVLTVGKKKDFYDKVSSYIPANSATDENNGSDPKGQDYECTLKVNGIKVDVFKFDVRTVNNLPICFKDKNLPFDWINEPKTKETQHIVWNGFKILEPKPSIDAKLKYVSFFMGKEDLVQQERTNLKKHLLDISDYYKWLIAKY